MWGAIAAGVGALGSIIGGAMTNSANANLNSTNRKWQEKMWNMANEYNLPSAQMQRFADAGLNPNLIYGNMGSYQVSAPSAPNTHPYQNNFKDIPNYAVQAYQSFLQSQQTKSNIDLNESQQRKNDQESSLLAKQAEGQTIENTFNSKNLENALETVLQNLHNLKKDGAIKDEVYKQNVKETEIAIERLREATSNADKAAEEVQTQKAMTEQVGQQTETLKEQANYYKAAGYEAMQKGETEKATRQLIASQILDNKALYDKLLSEAKLNDKQVDKLIADIAKEEAETDKINMERIRDKYGTNTAQIVSNFFRLNKNEISSKAKQVAGKNPIDYFLDSMGKKHPDISNSMRKVLKR